MASGNAVLIYWQRMSRSCSYRIQTENSGWLGLKEYYEIVDEARPLSGFVPTDADLFRKCISNHETKQSSKFQSDPSSNTSQSMFEK